MKKLTSRSVLFFIAIGCLYFAGVAAILYPMISNVVSLSTSRTTISDYTRTVEKLDNSEITETLADARKYNEDIFNNIYHDGLEKCLCNDDGLMCYIDIPTVNVYLPVYYGASDEALSKGCGFIENTSLPVGGESTHAVISGHTGLPTAEMFTNLDRISVGEVFYIHVLDQVLAYKVNKIIVVHPSDVTDLAIVPGEDLVTLITCTPYGINDKRLLVRGVRVPYEPEEPVTDQQPELQADSDPVDDALAKEIRHQITVISAIAVAAVILYIFALIWLVSSSHKPKHIATPEGQNVTQKTD